MDYTACDGFVILSHSRGKCSFVHVPTHVQPLPQHPEHNFAAEGDDEEMVGRLQSQLSTIDEDFHPLLLLASVPSVPQPPYPPTVAVPQQETAPPAPEPAAASEPPSNRSSISNAGISSLAARRGRLPPPVVCVVSEMPAVECPPRPHPLTSAGACQPRLQDSPHNAAAEAVLSQQGWFVRCRGCSQLTGATYHIGRQAIPFCCACLQRLFLLPSAHQGPFEEHLVVIHQAWKRSGQ